MGFSGWLGMGLSSREILLILLMVAFRGEYLQPLGSHSLIFVTSSVTMESKNLLFFTLKSYRLQPSTRIQAHRTLS